MSENQPDVLFLKSVSNGHPRGYSYLTISKENYTIQNGDILEFEMYIDIVSPVVQAGVEMHFKEGLPMRDRRIIDQHYFSSRPYTYLMDAANDWYKRKMDLSNVAGETIESFELAIVAHLKGTYIACFRDIKITHNGNVRHRIYQQGDPSIIEEKLQLGFSENVLLPIHWEEYRARMLDFVSPYLLSPEIQLAELLVSLTPEQKEDWMPVIEKAKGRLDRESYLNYDDDTFQYSLSEVREILKPLLKPAKSFITHLIGHAHIDMNWLWVWEETVKVCLRDFRTMSDLMETFSFFRFSQSQAAVYKAVLDYDPALFDKIKEFVRNGQWEITASMWVEGDENMASGEALVRQFLLAHTFIKKHFEVEPLICWQPDLFGHVATMPQILVKCGIKYYYFMRCAKQNPSVFQWRSPDGSEVIAAATPNYNGHIGFETQYHAFDLYKNQKMKDYMHCYGVGDHGGGPTIRDIKRALEISKNPSLPSMKFTTVRSYFETVEKYYDELPEIQDELQFIFEGCYTTHADIKERNRRAENLLTTLEMLSCFALPYELPYQKEFLRDAWERTCFNQFHDILPGSAIHAVYEEALPPMDAFIKGAEQGIQRAAIAITENIQVPFDDAEPLAVFNTANWERSGEVSVILPLLAHEYAEIIDPRGNTIDCQCINRKPDEAELIFFAEKIPSCGYRTYGWKKTQKREPELPAGEVDGKIVLENKFYRLTIEKDRGLITGLFDKRMKKELISEGGAFNRLQLLHEDPTEMSAWEIGNISYVEQLEEPMEIGVTEQGPVRSTARIVFQKSRSTFIQYISLLRDSTKIFFSTTVDWYETGSRKTGSKFLKTAFDSTVSDNANSFFEIPFGAIQRVRGEQEYPTQNWFALADDDYALVLSNCSKYGCDVNGKTMRLSLLRSSYEPDPDPDSGRHTIRYALEPIPGSFLPSKAIRSGYELNKPLNAAAVKRGGEKLPPEQAFLTFDCENIILSAYKLSEADEAYMLRIYETDGRACDCKVTFSVPLMGVYETDMLERPMSAKPVAFEEKDFVIRVSPYEIKTLKIFTEPYSWERHHDFPAV